jgi:hypothetical protein
MVNNKEIVDFIISLLQHSVKRVFRGAGPSKAGLARLRFGIAGRRRRAVECASSKSFPSSTADTTPSPRQKSFPRREFFPNFS